MDDNLHERISSDKSAYGRVIEQLVFGDSCLDFRSGGEACRLREAIALLEELRKEWKTNEEPCEP